MSNDKPSDKTALKDSKDKSDAKDASTEPVGVPYWKLFRAADTLDKFLLAIGTLAALGNGAMLPVFTIIFGEFTDIFGMADPSTFDAKVRDLALKFLYIAIATAVASYVEMAAWMWSAHRQVNRLRQQYLAAMLRQDVAFFDTESTTGAALQGLNEDCQLIQAAISEKMSTFLKMCSTFATGMIIAFAKGWDMTLVMLATTPFTMAVAWAISYVTTSATAQVNESYGKANSVAQQSLAQIRTVAAFGQERKALADYSAQLDLPLAVGIRLSVAAGLAMGGLQFVMFASYAVAFVYGAWRVYMGVYTGGQVLNVLLAVMMGGFQMGMVSPNLQHFNKGRAAATRVFAMLERKPGIDAQAGGQKLSSVAGAISLRNVAFCYPARPDVQVLKGLSLDIPAGKTVALVGGSGSGKSTVAALVERFYDPQAGCIALDGVDIRALDLHWLRDQMALVSQEPTLFAISIADNIALGKEGATREEVVAAAQAANAHGFISALPNGYATHVGERGVQMSGGQKQRIAIARAILKNPKILLLDEATSALDTQSERLVQGALNRLTVDRTTLVIAHRLSTIRHADVIAVMSKGEIVEQGRHEELIARADGAYTALVRLQLQQHEEGEGAGEEELLPAAAEGAAAEKPGMVALQIEGAAEAPAVQVVQSSGGEEAALPLAVIKQADSAAADKQGKDGKEKAPAEPEVKVPMSRLAALNKPEWPYALVGLLSSAASGCAQPAVSFLLSEFIVIFYLPDKEEMKRKASFYGLMFFVVAVGLFISYTLMHGSLGIMAQRMSRRLRVMVLGAILRQEVGWFDREENSSGVLSSRLATDTLHVRGAVGDVIGAVMLNLFNMAFGFAIAYAYNWRMALVVTALLPVVALAGVYQMKFAVGAQGEVDELYARSNQAVTEGLSSIRVIQAYNLQGHISGQYARSLGEVIATLSRRCNVAGIANSYSNFIMFAMYALIVWFGAQEIKYQRSDFNGMLKAFFGIMFAALGISQSALQFPDMGNAQAAVQRVFPLLDRKSAIDPDSAEGETLPPGALRGEIELRSVRFCYPARPSVTIFADFSLTIPAGKTVALVGQSGSGKSTVVGLVQRFYDPLAGAVLLDGCDLRRYNLRWLRSCMGLVSQEPLLFSASILDNIRYGKPDATMQEVEEAARAANAHGFISALPEGYATHVGEQGVQLSGGQKQRIAIARAIVRKPKILLLDEATSALDAASEREVQSALDAIMVGPTSVVIAHRLSTIRKADLICVVQGGQVVETGGHEALMGVQGGCYAQLVRAQESSAVVY